MIKLERLDATKSSTCLIGLLLSLDREENELMKWVLDPPFQRGSVWTLQQKEAWWESIIMDIPTPAIFINRFPMHKNVVKKWRGREIVIDGKQRIEATLGFVKNEFPVRGEFWKDQDDSFKRQLKNHWHCPVVTTQYRTIKECANLYVKLLTSGTSHTQEEIEKAKKFLEEME